MNWLSRRFADRRTPVGNFMRARLSVVALLLVIASVTFVPLFAVAQTAPSATSSSLIVKVVAGLTTDQQAEIVARNGGTLTSSIPALRLLIVTVPAEQLDATLARYQVDPQVQNAELNKTRTSETVPNDPLYVNQWALPKIGWDQVFGVITPTGSAKLALLDTGVDASHPELASKVISGTSILDGSNGMNDPSGHGTWLAGIIAAQTDSIPADGIAAVAYAGVQIVPVTVLNANGEGRDSDVIAGVIWAADHGADVILMAFSAPEFSQNLQDAIDYAWSKGAVVVAAVGNDAVNTPPFPAGDRGVMGVAATDPNDALASFSNAGQAVFIAAPGVDIQTVDINDNYIVISGTSASAAYVAGLAAFMKSVDPTLSNGVIVGRIARNADPAGTQDETGNGRINMPRALADTSTEFIQPAGAAPVGAGGPFVGPYVAAARNLNISFAGTGGGSLGVTVNLGAITYPTTGSGACTGATGNGTASITIVGSCNVNLTDNGAVATITASPNAASVFAGWTVSLGGCSGTTNPCSVGPLGGGGNPLTVTFNTNVAPVASSQSVTTNEDTPKAITLSATDANGQNLTFSIVSSPSHGTLGTLSAPSCTVTAGTSTCTTSVTYTPAANYNGADSFTFRANDGGLNSNTATVSITVTAVNDAPTASAQSVSTNEDTSLVITLGGSDIDNTSLTFSIVSTPTHGSLSAITGTSCSTVTNGTGTPGSTCTASVTYTPALNYSGPDSFTFKVNDGSLDSPAATVSITVIAVNDAPTANSQSVSTNEDTALSITLSGSDIDSPSLSFAIVSGPSHGTLGTVGAPVCGGGSCTASVTYTPATNYNGPDSFTFKVNDGSLDSTAATVSITVNAVNDAPVANAQSPSTNEDTPLIITLGASDVDSTSLTFSIVGTPAHGSLSVITGTSCSAVSNGTGTPGSSCTASVTYTPATNYNGPDSFTFKVNDGSLDSSAATVSITVNAVNDAPVADAQSVTTDEDTPKAITLGGTDVDSSSLTFSIVTGPSHGSLGPIGVPSCSPSGAGTSCTASVTYAPAADYNGPDSFTFKVNDGSLDSNAATVSITINAVNDAPVANAQSPTTDEDTPLAITLSGTDIDSASLTFSIVGTPSHGTLGTIGAPGCTPSGAGTSCTAGVTYTPKANFNGADSFTFKVNDGSLDSSTATVSITINPVNDAPVAANDIYTLYTDTMLAVAAPGVLGNDLDVDSTFTAVLVSGPAHAAAFAFNPDGSFTYTPAASYVGPDSFTYKANDGFLDSAVVTVSLNVLAANANPVAVNDVYSTTQDTPLTVLAPGVIGNDLERRGESLTATLMSAPLYADAFTLNTDGSFSYTPMSGFVGPDSFAYTVTSTNGTSNVAMVTIQVLATGATPVAVNDTFTTAEDTTLMVGAPGFVANDTGTPLTATLVSGPLHASSFTFGADGSFQYTPAADYNGPDSFMYRVSDGVNLSNVAMVTISVTAVNDPPVAAGQTVTTDEDTAKIITLSATDVDSAGLTFSIVGGPSHGTLGSISAPSCSPSDLGSSCTATVTYTPAPNYNGPDSFTFKANDGSADSSVATVSITVIPVNDEPTAIAQSVTTNEDTPTLITLAGTDVETAPANLTFTIVTPPVHGSLSGTPPNVTYTANANYNGSDSFTFTVTDRGDPDNCGAPSTSCAAAKTSLPATVSITVTAVNDAPQAQSQSVVTDEDTPLSITLRARDIDGPTPLAFSIVTGPSHGVLGLVSAPSCTAVEPITSGTPGTSCTATVTYTPNADYNGSDSFTFRANDGSLDSNVATVSIAVNPINDAPVSSGQSVSTAEDTVKTITLSASDIDSASLTFSIASAPGNGALGAISGTVCTPAGAGATCTASIDYTPNLNYNGSDSFTFKVNDGALDSTVATVSITVTPADDAPQAQSQSTSTNEDTAVIVTLRARDIDGPTPLAFTIDSSPSHGTLGPISAPSCAEVQPIVSGTPGTSCTATVTYTPAADYNGPDSFTFKASDGSLDSNVATVSIAVNPVNDAPLSNGQSVPTAEDTIKTITLGGSDIDSASLTFSIVTPPSNGVLSAITGTSCLPAGAGSTCTASVDYTPNLNFNGSDSFTFKVNDGSADSATATVSIVVTAVDDAPVSFDRTASTSEDMPKTITLKATDVDNPGLTFSIVGGPAHGMLGAIGGTACTTDGTGLTTCTADVTYTPAANYSGADAFTFKTNDGTADSNVATVSVSVNAVNDPPTANSVTLSTYTSATITLSGSDIDSPGLTFSAVSGPAHGTLGSITGTSCAASGAGSSCTAAIVYTPATGYTGPDAFTYRVFDGTDYSDAATVSITVTEPPYTFVGFKQPVDNPPTVNTVNSGQTIPQKWQLFNSLTGAPISDPTSFVSLTSYQVLCGSWSGDVSSAVEELAPGSSGLQYLGNGSWQWNWQTSKAWAKTCRISVLKLKDGSEHTAKFNFVK